MNANTFQEHELVRHTVKTGNEWQTKRANYTDEDVESMLRSLNASTFEDLTRECASKLIASLQSGAAVFDTHPIVSHERINDFHEFTKFNPLALNPTAAPEKLICNSSGSGKVFICASSISANFPGW